MQNFNIVPDNTHVTCMADVYGRAGMLAEAEKWATSANNKIAWTSVLQGACIRGNMTYAEHAFARAVALDPMDPSLYVLMSSVYATNNQWDKQQEVRHAIDSLKLKKVPGITWIEVNGVVHRLVMEDQEHENIEMIQETIKSLRKELDAISKYRPKTSRVLRPDMTEAQKEDLLWQHSERLAIGLGLLFTPAGSELLLWKNLRMCEDCHEVFKLISQVTNRKINIRDKSRFHHIENGKCSCNDFY
eukprot:Phypoly_transcript_05659.p1 GENE.Phypoly_transcript_05659~~Phypoly_transcript_05659.p1  ORF type:complete len:245 (+),score=26.98 Phypoly_transcript_05659:1127-1861(+)